MARVTGGLFSMSARGTIGKTITYSVWKGISYAKEWFKPANPKDPKQVNVRTALTLLVAKWQGYGQVTWDIFDAFAEGTGMSGFNMFVSRGMDAYILQLTSSVLPTSVALSGEPPTEVWTWA